MLNGTVEQPAWTWTSRGLFCMCDSGVARCQSQHQCHFWRMNLMLEVIARASELGSCQSNLCHSRGYERWQKSKDSLKACFENVNLYVHVLNLLCFCVHSSCGRKQCGSWFLISWLHQNYASWSDLDLHCFKWASTLENLSLGDTNNTGADQPAHPRSLISAFVILLFGSIICKFAIGEISIF